MKVLILILSLFLCFNLNAAQFNRQDLAIFYSDSLDVDVFIDSSVDVDLVSYLKNKKISVSFLYKFCEVNNLAYDFTDSYLYIYKKKSDDRFRYDDVIRKAEHESNVIHFYEKLCRQIFYSKFRENHIPISLEHEFIYAEAKRVAEALKYKEVFNLSVCK